MAKIWPFVAKIWPLFGQNWPFWRFSASIFQMPLWIFLIFGMKVLMVLFEKIILYMPEKFLIGRNFGHLRSKFWPFFGQNWQIWEFLAYNFETSPWIFLTFGMEVVLMVFFDQILVLIIIFLKIFSKSKTNTPLKTKILTLWITH